MGPGTNPCEGTPVSQKPQSEFSKSARQAWERFLVPFDVVDQDGNDAHKNPKSIRSEFNNMVRRPYVVAAAAITLPGMFLSCNADPNVPVAASAIFSVMMASIIAFKGFTYEWLLNHKYRKPQYYVDTTSKASNAATPSVEMHEKGRLLYANLFLGSIALAAAGTIGYMGVKGIPLGTVTGMLAVVVSMVSPMFTPFLAARLRAQKVLSGEWSTTTELPKKKPKPVKAASPISIPGLAPAPHYG